MHSHALSRREFVMAAAGAVALPGIAPDRWADVKAFVDGERQAGTVPGASLIASKGGKVAVEWHTGTYCGLAGRTLKLDGKVLHPLYSFSKLVSATVIAMAVADGLLQWDRPVREVAPEFAGGGKDGITLRHLLTHSAGIPSVPMGAVRDDAEWDAAWKAACAAKTEWEPGSRTAYHALSGQFVAATLVRRVMGGTPWPKICRERLFEPLGARTLTFVVPPDTAPAALTPQPKELPHSLHDFYGLAGQPAGGCMGTVRDALKVVQLHNNRGVWGRRRLLAERVWEEMHTVQYRREIAVARAAGKAPAHEPWGLGPLLRGEGPKMGSHDWFGFADQASPTVFGHAGIDTVIGVGDPATDYALFFVTTDSPKPPEKTVLLRNGVTDRVFAALAQVG